MLEIDEDGNRFWKNKKGKLHRKDGPAMEYRNGGKSWWVHGNKHRIDGPAVEWMNGSKAWWLNGKEYSAEQYREKVKEYVRD